MPDKFPNRKQMRLQNFDYSNDGAYFITICTYNRKCLFSNIVGAIHESPEVQLNQNGLILDYYIQKLNSRFDLRIDKYVIMPNHIHLIAVIEKSERAIRESPLQKRDLISKAMGYLKMNVSRDIHRNGYNQNIWQRSYYDHIIRDKNDYLNIWNYIDTNPAKWTLDEYYE